LGAGAPNTLGGYGGTFPDPFAGAPSIGAVYGDLDFRSVGTGSIINYFTTGSSPTQKLVINFTNGQFYNGVSGSVITSQIILSEGSNTVEVHTTTVNHNGNLATTIEGVQNATGTLSTTVSGRNGSLWSVGAGDAYVFAPPALTYSWSPSLAAVANPTASGLTAGPHVFTVTVTNEFGCTGTGSVTITPTTCAGDDTLRLTAFLEGHLSVGPAPGLMLSTLYDLYTNGFGNNDDPTATDTITVGLWANNDDSLALPDPGHSVRVVLHNDGTAKAAFPSTMTGNVYWIAVRTRTTIETWSKTPITMGPSVPYDFTNAMIKAYDDGFNAPMKTMPAPNVGKFAFYSGDINQDGGINGDDMNFIDNNNGGFGPDNSDLNGDMGTNGDDMNFVDNNATLGLFYARPFAAE